LTTHYYIWYRVQGDVIAAHAAVDGVIKDMYATVGVLGRRLVRRDDPRTWMEIYENVADARRFEEALRMAEQRRNVAEFIEGGKRHLEPFLNPV
jgi:hypothetical protein